MKKRVFSVIVCLTFFLSLTLSVRAETIFVHDYANILTSEQEARLTHTAREIRDSSGVEAVILVTPTLYGEAGADFADKFYENNRYGDNFTLFLVDVGSRQWYISTVGMSVDLISERELTAIENKVVPMLSDGRYYDAFSQYLKILPKYLASDSASVNVPLSLLLGAAVAAVAILVMRGTMNTRRKQHCAGNYMTDGTYHLHTQQDLFLYSNLSKRPRPQNNSSGTSIHRSSSGTRHGGRGGRF